MATVAVNGSMLFVRYTQAPETADGPFDVEVIADHTSMGLAFPINIMFVDATGNAARVLIKTADFEYQIVH